MLQTVAKAKMKEKKQATSVQDLLESSAGPLDNLINSSFPSSNYILFDVLHWSIIDCGFWKENI